MKKLLSIGIILMLIIGVLLAGCTGSMNQGNSSTTGTGTATKVTFGAAAKVTDTNINDAQYDRLVRVFCLQGLAWISPSGALEPELARSWEASSDLKKWTFRLYENATWSDGQPVTANDVKFTLENLAKFTPSKKLYIDNVESVETPDAHTVVVNLKNPDANVLYTWDVIKMLPEHIYKNVQNVTTFNGKEASIGSGPYIFDSYDKDASLLVFKANPNYWKGKPSVDVIEYRMYKTMDAVIQAFLIGEIDAPASTVNYYYVPKILQDNDAGIITARNGGISLSLYFNTEKPPYDDKVFREAMSYAINYEEMKNLFTAGYGSIPTAGYIPEGWDGYVETRTLTYDINKSKALFDSMRMVDKDGDGFRELPDGKKFQGEIIARSDVADHVRAVEMLKKYFNAVGIDIKVKWADLATFDTITGETQEMILSSITYFGLSMDAGYGTSQVGKSGQGHCWCMFNNSTYVSIRDQLIKTVDPDARRKLGGDLQRCYADNLPVITVYSMDQIQPYNKKYTGWVIGPAKGVLNPETIMKLKLA